MSLLTSRTPVLPLGALPRVDLLPPSEMRRRDMLSRARTWVYIGIAALAVAALAIGGAFAYNMAASLRLAAEQARTQQILVGIAELSEVSRALSLRSELSSTGETAMAGDIEWARVIGAVRGRLPPGVAISDYALAAGPIPAGEDDSAAASGAAGTITVRSLDPLALVNLTRQLRGLDAIRVTEVDELVREEDDPLFEYRIRFDIDQSVHTGAYALEGK
jgi:hypothetical protein